MSLLCFFFFKQKTAYEMRISDWSSDVCSSDLHAVDRAFDQLRILDRLDIIRLHFGIDIHEARDFFLRLRIDARHRAGRERDERQRRKRGGALPQGEADRKSVV